MSDYDRPAIEEVLQEETGIVAVPVRVVDPVRVDPLPTIFADPRTLLVPISGGDMIRRLLREDPRRARVTIIVSNQDVMISGRAGNLEKFGGGYVPAGIPIPLHMDVKSEMFVRGVTMTTTGADIQWAAPADVAVVTVFEEYWAH